MCFDLMKVRIEDDFSASIIQVVVFSSDVIYVNSTEDGNCCNTTVDNRLRSNFIPCFFIDPLFEYLARNKRVLRHGTDSFSIGTEILRQTFNLSCPVIIKNYEVNIVLISKVCCKGKVRGYLFSSVILCFPYIPPGKVLTFHNRIAGGQNEFFVGQVLICLIGLCSPVIIIDISNGELVLYIFRPDSSITADRDFICKVSSAINPLGNIAILWRNSGHIVNTIGRIRINRSCTYFSGLVFFIEGYSIVNLIKIGYYLCIFFWFKGFINSLNYCNFLVGIDESCCPIGYIILAVNSRRQSSDSFAFYNLLRIGRITLAVKEGYSPILNAFIRVFFKDSCISRIT